MTNTSTVLADSVTVTVGDTTYELIPNINSVRGINRAHGGLRPALQAVNDLNYDAVAQIIACGTAAGMKVSEVEDLGERLWSDEGRAEVLGQVSEFLILLLNGGQAPKTTTDDMPDNGDAAGNG